jgi:hypothetical protein
MAGLGAKLFTAFSKLTAAQVNGYLMDQSIMRFASATVRDAAFGGAGEPTLAEGMTCYLDDTNQIQSYTGSAWVGVAASSTVADVSSAMVYITQATLTGAAVNIEGCFSSKYDSYMLQFTNAKTAGALVATWQLLNGSTPISTASYNIQRASLQAGSWVTTSASGQTAGNLITTGSDVGQGGTFTIYNPFLTTTTYSQSTSLYSGNIGGTYLELMPSNNTGTTSCDGIRLIATASTWTTGKVIVYGFRQS